jgi:hypothetical protein
MIGLATLRGLAMSDLGGGLDLEALWIIVKPELIKSFDALFGEAASDT